MPWLADPSTLENFSFYWKRVQLTFWFNPQFFVRLAGDCHPSLSIPLGRLMNLGFRSSVPSRPWNRAITPQNWLPIQTQPAISLSPEKTTPTVKHTFSSHCYGVSLHFDFELLWFLNSKNKDNASYFSRFVRTSKEIMSVGSTDEHFWKR